jgi:endonuclease-8
MPEGDTIHYAANRIRPILLGEVPDELTTPHPRFRADRWPEKLDGRAVTSVDAHGKHLFLRFEGDLVIHSHLRMTGSWDTYLRGERWRTSPRRAWLVVRRGDGEVVQFGGPLLELLTSGRTRFDQRIAGLGPDIIKPEFDEAEFLRRLRRDDPTRTIGDALLDQKTLAGIGNLWKIEGCFLAGIDPWRRTADVDDEEALRIVRSVRPLMQESAMHGMQDAYRTIYNRKGRPCPRCGELIASRGQGDDNRITYWCPGCQL